MCTGPERPNQSVTDSTSSMKGITKLTVETEDSFSSLLELAANNDLEGFKRSVELDASAMMRWGYGWFARKVQSRLLMRRGLL